MKAITTIFVFAVLVTQALGYFIKVPTRPVGAPVIDHTQWVRIQKLMIPLFENICETSKNLNICKSAEEFSLDGADYMKPEAITNLQNLISTGLLPKGVIFSEYKPDHFNELKIVYEVLYNAKDFHTFYKAAAWARQNLNCGLYVNAIYMAIQSRKDTESLYIPAPYELLPNYFIDQRVIIQAAKIFGKDYNDYVVPMDTIHNEGDSYVIDANYTGIFYDNDDDSKLAYFREDIGLNSYYYLRKLRMVPWFNDDVNESYGENMFQMMKQFTARYNLERYANGLPEVDGINWDTPIDSPYDPMLIYSNGAEFGHRTSLVELSESEDLIQLKTIENNLSSVVDHLNQRGYNKTQILNHLIEILITDDRSYDMLARKLLGKDVTNNGETSALDHYMTSLRDPLFWKINTKIVNMIDDALRVLPTYTRNELFFPGVEVVNIEMKKIITAYDYFTFDVTDALKIEESGFRIKIGQPRLNHKQFTIKVNISSLVSQKGIMKIYLGPKLMPGELGAKKNLFTLLDISQVNLKVGSNIITRSSDNMNHFSEDLMLLNTIRKKVEYAELGLDSLPLKKIQSQVGYPSRLILPKGTLEGLPIQIFVFIAPYMKGSIDKGYSINNLKLNTALLSPGYPLDLMIQDPQLFGLPNAMIKCVSVTQKGDSKVENYGGPGVTKAWYTTNTYDSSGTSYNSKNKQYGSKNEYYTKNNVRNGEEIDFKSNEENFDVTELDTTPNLYMANTFDYSSKRKPFDYKAKKAEFDRKDFSARKNFTKYYATTEKTQNEKDIVVSTATSEIVNSSEKNVNTTPSTDNNGNLSYRVDTINDISTLKITEIPRTSTPEDILKIEVLPLPAMLKKDVEGEKFNYKEKKIERDYMIKGKKIELDQLIKDAKMIQKIKHREMDSRIKDKDTVALNTKDFDLARKFDKKDFIGTKVDDKRENIITPNSTSPGINSHDFDKNMEQYLSKEDNVILDSIETKDQVANFAQDIKIVPKTERGKVDIGKVILNQDSTEMDSQITKDDSYTQNHTKPIPLLDAMEKDVLDLQFLLVDTD